MLNIDNKIVGLNPCVYLCIFVYNFNKQHLILAKFYVNSASSIGSKSAKFQLGLNLSMQTIVTVAFVRSP